MFDIVLNIPLPSMLEFPNYFAEILRNAKISNQKLRLYLKSFENSTMAYY